MPSSNPIKCRQEAVHYAKNFRVDSILFISSNAQLERLDTLHTLVAQNLTIVVPFMKTYEKFGYARRICDIGLAKPLNDSTPFPTLVTQKGLRENNYDKILVRVYIIIAH